jgi:2-succinyl-5-enolpyruvyl-6-hydroxy-3-cyclohexene-1-carboxylate synthase
VSLGDLSLACATALVKTLADGGVRHASVSPGSRSTPLALALARHPDIEVHVHLDERSGAFFALGLAKALRRPVVIACTSGTAAAELFPAVVEASQSRMPLILLTADRPPRLRGTGANQTIDQVRLYGAYARAYVEAPVPSSADDVPRWSGAGQEALFACGGVAPGPVQIDCPFEEPLIPAGEPVGAGAPIGVFYELPEDANPAPAPEAAEQVAHAVGGKRGLVVSGGSAWFPPGLTVHLAERLGWPVMAEPSSDARRPGQSLAAGQALAASSWIDAHGPELVLQVGAAPTTRATQRLVASARELIVVDAHHLDPDPEGHASLRVHADAERLVAALEPMPLSRAPVEWLDDWRLADTVARRAMDEVLDRTEAATELQIARDLATAVPNGGTLFVGNSMPVRDLDYAMAPREGLRIVANRGASGIDGLVSTAMGIASARTGPTFALLGDLSLLYDAGALLWGGERFEPALTIVVPNNGGGQIFSTLGQQELPESERRLFTTPHSLDLGAICAAAGVGRALVEDVWAFQGALRHAESRGGLQVIEVAIDPARSIAQRHEVQAAVDEALRELA